MRRSHATRTMSLHSLSSPYCAQAFLESVEQVQRDMQYGDGAGSQDSFHDHLDGSSSPFLEPFDSVLMEAKVIRMTYNTSEWSLFQRLLVLSLLWSCVVFFFFLKKMI